MKHYYPKLLLLVLISVSASTLTTFAAPVPITNAGFEDISGESPFNEFTFGALNGWELYDPQLVTDGGDGPTFFIGTLTPFEADPIGAPGVYTNFPNGAAEGERVGIAFNYDGSDGQGEYGFYQELNTTLQPHTTYTLEVEIGNIDSGTAMNGSLFPLAGFPGYRVELQAGGTMLAQDDNQLAGSIADGEFATSTLSYTTGAEHALMNQNLGILLVNLNIEDPAFPNSDNEVDFDDVRLDASPALAGDFNLSGSVDGADLLAWQREPLDATQSPLALDLWQSHYGSHAAPISHSAAVPEPTALALFAMGSTMLLSRTRRTR